jgi:asparagine synthetase B (glutamine-hydrolysing)
MGIIDKKYCMSSFLMIRTLYSNNKAFSNKFSTKIFSENQDRFPVNDSYELEERLKIEIQKASKAGKAALALSGGIDSAILAKYMPKGSVAYTFKCVVPGIEVADETPMAKKYAEECGLEHRTVEIYWEDFEKYAPLLMKNKGAPIHSIEVQIYKAALQAKKDGFDTLIFGESADVNFGGQDGLLSKDWTLDEYIARYSYVDPKKVLKNPISIREPFEKYSKNGVMNVHEFNRHVYYCESMGSYENATECAEIKLCAPYSKTYLNVPLDYKRVRNGDSKYLVREIFKRLYPAFVAPKKLPMPRPMNEWMQDWCGPKREEFIPNCHLSLNGDQRWLVWALETFLNIIEE